MRGLPVAISAGWAFVLGALLTVVGMSSSGPVADVLALLLLVVLLFIVGCGVVWISVVTLNRPSFAVPPHLRDQPGVLGRRRPR